MERLDDMNSEIGEAIEEQPEVDPLAKAWGKRLAKAQKYWGPFFKRCKHNRKLVQNFNTQAEANSEDYVKYRANLILGMINVLLPTIYSRNPDLVVQPRQQQFKSTLFCKTLETILNRQL